MKRLGPEKHLRRLAASPVVYSVRIRQLRAEPSTRTEIHLDARHKVQQTCLLGTEDVQFISLGRFRRSRSIAVDA